MAHRYSEHVPRTGQKYRPSAPSARKSSTRNTHRPPPVPSAGGSFHRLGVSTIGGSGAQEEDCSFLEVKDIFFTNLVLLGFNPLQQEEKVKMTFTRLDCRPMIHLLIARVCMYACMACIVYIHTACIHTCIHVQRNIECTCTYTVHIRRYVSILCINLCMFIWYTHCMCVCCVCYSWHIARCSCIDLNVSLA